MSGLMRSLLLGAAVAVGGCAIAVPALAQFGGYGPQNRYEERIMRGNGWSSGDYFGAPLQQRQQPQPPSNYQPGLNNNIRYRSNSCAMYLNC